MLSFFTLPLVSSVVSLSVIGNVGRREDFSN